MIDWLCWMDVSDLSKLYSDCSYWRFDDAYCMDMCQ